MIPTLEAADLTLRYGTTTVLDKLQVQIPQGRVTTLIGPNGCGKSTLLRSMSRLLAPSGGRVLLDGKDIHRLHTRDVARQLAILPQGPVAPEGLTVEDLVWFGRHPHAGRLARRTPEDAGHVARALDQTGMTVFASRPLEALSGGQRQRAWIAMSLSQDTPTILLDEPTTYLDLSHQLEVLHTVRHLNERGKTVVMVLHDLNQAVRYSDHLIVMARGHVVAHGDPNDVMTPELLRRVFGLEAHLLRDPDTGRPHIIPYGLARRAE